MSIALAAVASAASAADMIETAPAPSYDWSGFYVGVNGGYAWGDADFAFASAGSESNTDLTGGFIGGTIGYNYQIQSFLIGIEGDFDWYGLDGSDSCPNDFFDCDVDVDWLGTVRARAGYAFDNLLVFATGGLAVANVDADTPPFAEGEDFDDTYVGYTVGGGLEIGITQDWSIKAEYAYVDLGSETADAGELDPGETDVDIDFHTVKFGVNYRF
ncbi:outer membrane protein [Mangrovicella endophytica]|uniref:outer membrane protein n=1 Tax=Mangrovicella endophytica TaxID=2066697 RepID=UPI002477D409|nr:outer membrane protein [Mangrovicella endophytica]